MVTVPCRLEQPLDGEERRFPRKTSRASLLTRIDSSKSGPAFMQRVSVRCDAYATRTKGLKSLISAGQASTRQDDVQFPAGMAMVWVELNSLAVVIHRPRTVTLSRMRHAPGAGRIGELRLDGERC